MSLLLLFACSTPVSVPDGLFELDHATDGSGVSLGEAEVGELGLAIDTEAGTGSLAIQLDDSAETVTFALVARDPADWNVGCPTNYSSTRVETFDLDADVLEIGPLQLTAPVLTATCGEGDEGDPVLASWEGDALAEPMVVFRGR